MGVRMLADDGIDVAFVEHGGVSEIFATALPGGASDLVHLIQRLWKVVHDSEVEILEMRVFGDLGAFATCTKFLHELHGGIDWPLLHLEGGSCVGGEVAGVQLRGVAGCPVDSIWQDGRVVGRAFEDEFARYCVLGDLRPPQSHGSRGAQARETIEGMIEGLASAGMDLFDVVRTWFFLDDINQWYSEFNRTRSEIYRAAGVFDRYVPASTGIGARNQHGAAVVASVLGMKAKGGGVTVRALPSPMQCPALAYGSSFSRAAEVVMPAFRSILVSGTASIDPDGATVHLGDVDAQVGHTLEVVGAILESREMDFADVIRGNAYFKDTAAAVALEEHAYRHGLPLSRVVISLNEVCREDLLFELEVDAVRVEAAE